MCPDHFAILQGQWHYSLLPDVYFIFQCKYHFQCVHWLPLVSLTLSDLSCSGLIISGSLLAILTGGQRSPWCEVVSLFKFTFMTSSIGSIGENLQIIIAESSHLLKYMQFC